MLNTIMSACDNRYKRPCEQCGDCSYGEYCPHDCEKCLDYIHNSNHAKLGARIASMIVHIWQIFIHASIRAVIHLK